LGVLKLILSGFPLIKLFDQLTFFYEEEASKMDAASN